MEKFDLVIQGGTVITHTDFKKIDLAIIDGRIAAIGKNLKGEKIIDAQGLYLLPGGVDPHVHLNMPTATSITSDDWDSGTRAAACGGTTTVIDFVEPEAGQTLEAALDQRKSEAEGVAWIDYALHMTINNAQTETLDQIPGLLEKGITSFKLYTTYAGMKLDDVSLVKVMKSISANHGICMVHAEDDGLIRLATEKLVSEGKLSSKWFPKSRPADSEHAAVNRCIEIAAENGVLLYLVHLSTGDSVQAVKQARQNNIRVMAETCPQYLLLSDQLFADGDAYLAASLVCSPPLRAVIENGQMWDQMQQDNIQCMGSDHCSFNIHPQKELVLNDFRRIPGGLPGIELRYPIIHTFGVQKGYLSLQDWVRICSTQPAQVFGLWPQKGSLEVGADADIVLFDPEKRVKIEPGFLHENVDYSPYDGFELHGYPVKIIIKGEVFSENGKIIQKERTGKFLKCSYPSFL